MKSEWILPYDDIRSLILDAKTFSVRDCICRVQQELIGQACQFPVHTCLNFSQSERPARDGDVSQAEALALLDKVEQIGLVHTVSNVAQGVFYVCNCCGCCCGLYEGYHGIWSRGIGRACQLLRRDRSGRSAQGCGTCIERCQVNAISESDGISVVDRARCIGCGLCVTGCPHEVARLERKADAEMIHPPEVFTDWEKMRLQNRGLTGDLTCHLKNQK